MIRKNIYLALLIISIASIQAFKVSAATVFENIDGDTFSSNVAGGTTQYFMNTLYGGSGKLGKLQVYLKWDGTLDLQAYVSCYTGANATGANNCYGFGTDWKIGNIVTVSKTGAGEGYVTFDFTDGNAIIPNDRYLVLRISGSNYPTGLYVLGTTSNTDPLGVCGFNCGNLASWRYTLTDQNGFDVFYSQVKNTSAGVINLRDGSSTSAAILKTLPEDWVVRVDTTTVASGSPVTADGYNWYQVTDPTDNVSGWMIGEDASSTTHYLSYDSSRQTEFASTSVDYVATSSRPDLILEAIDHYYNNSSSTDSLYSSDNVSGVYLISHLNDKDFEKKIIWGIAARESGPNFDNQNVSFDYGHGIMQATFDALGHEPSDPHSTYDNRGIGSLVSIPLCSSVNSSNYVNCYTDAGTGNNNPKPYKAYSLNPTYTFKQYSNTKQSIYANIKDGMQVLANKLSNYKDIATSTTVLSTTFSPEERRTISATESYNGNNCGYVNLVASSTDIIDTYFPTATSSDITTLLGKMHLVGNNAVCANLHSPGDLSIEDSKGRVVGVVNGEGRDDFPLAVYDKEQKFVKILAAEDDDYKYKVTGTGRGVYGIDITIKRGDKETKFNARNLPIVPGEVHTYTVDKTALGKGQKGVTINIDSDGDGKVDKVAKAGATISPEDFGRATAVSTVDQN